MFIPCTTDNAVIPTKAICIIMSVAMYVHTYLYNYTVMHVLVHTYTCMLMGKFFIQVTEASSSATTG